MDNRFDMSAKVITQIINPYIAGVYYILGRVFDFPGGEHVVGNIVVLSLILDVVLRLARKRYGSKTSGYDGDILVTDVEGAILVFHKDPGNFENGKSLRFRVVNKPPKT